MLVSHLGAITYIKRQGGPCPCCFWVRAGRLYAYIQPHCDVVVCDRDTGDATRVRPEEGGGHDRGQQLEPGRCPEYRYRSREPDPDHPGRGLRCARASSLVRDVCD